MMSDETKKQVILMSVGIVLHNLVLFLICLIWFRSVPVFFGILTGMAAAELWLLSMAIQRSCARHRPMKLTPEKRW